MTSAIRITFVCAAALTVFLPVSHAQSVYKPEGLQPGDPYRIAFVTEGTIDATSTAISTYNDFVAQEAKATGSLLTDLATDWTAIASTPTVDALDNTSTDPSPPGDNGVPIYLPDGITRVVPNYDVLWSGVVGFGVLEAAIRLMPNGLEQPDRNLWVWTGTSLQGVRSNPLGSASSTQGFFVSSNSRWSTNGIRDPAVPGLLYGISGILIAIPEPTTATLLILGVLGGGMRRQR